jgi:type III pantothenate kinase
MDINLLAINVGNSRTAIAAFAAGEMLEVIRVPNDRPDELATALRQKWGRLGIYDQPAIVGASVNPAVVPVVEEAVMNVADKAVVWVGKQIDLPINVLTDSPNQTGVDRIVTMAAAFEQLGKACVVVDAGTAVTVGCCNDNGDFLGGAIAPGAAMQLKALHEYTAALPSVSLAVPTGSVGTSTEQAMLQGVYHGIRGMIKEFVESYATELGSWPEVIATGGDAETLFKDWELIHAISPDLTMYGIALAYANHHIAHGT